MYISIGISLLILGIMVGLGNGLTVEESIQVEGQRCGLPYAALPLIAGLFALIAWPYGLFSSLFEKR